MSFIKNKFFLLIASCMLVQFYFLNGLLFSTDQVIIHDTFKALPFFRYLLQNLQNGVIPFWTPYLNTGEPFWPYFVFLGFLDPINLVLILFGTLFKIQNYFTLYNWSVFIHILVFNLGCFSLIKFILVKLKMNIDILIPLIPIIFFGTISACALRQAFGTILIITFFPLLILYLIKFIEENKLKYLFILSTLISLQLNVSNPAFSFFQLCFFGLPIVYYILKKQGFNLNYKKIAILFSLVIFQSLITIYLSFTSDQYFPIGRYLSNSTEVNYEKGFTINNLDQYSQDIGTPAEFSDFFASLSFLFSQDYSEMPLLWGAIGLIFLLCSLLKISKSNFLFYIPFLFTILISLGDKIGLSTLLYYIFPPFRLIRHLEFFSSYTFFWSLFLIMFGIEFVYDKFKNIKNILVALSFIFSIYSYQEFIQDRIQNTPNFIRSEFPYKGNQFNLNREFIIKPFMEVQTYKEETFSHAEPLFLFKDSVRNFDNATNFLMPQRLKVFIQSSITNTAKFEYFGISKPKIQFKNQSHIQPVIEKFNANEITIQTPQMNEDSILISQNWFANWELKVNGNPILYEFKKDHPFIELNLPKGGNKIELKYNPLIIKIGLIILIFGYLLNIFIVLKKVGRAN